MSIVSACTAHVGVTGSFLPEDNAEKSSLYIERNAFIACFPLKHPGRNPGVTWWHSLSCTVLHSKLDTQFPFHIVIIQSHRWQLTICIDKNFKDFLIIVHCICYFLGSAIFQIPVFKADHSILSLINVIPNTSVSLFTLVD